MVVTRNPGGSKKRITAPKSKIFGPGVHTGAAKNDMRGRKEMVGKIHMQAAEMEIMNETGIKKLNEATLTELEKIHKLASEKVVIAQGSAAQIAGPHRQRMLNKSMAMEVIRDEARIRLNQKKK